MRSVWNWEPDVRIEWVELVGRGDPPSLLAATHDGRLHLLDPRSGCEQLSAPVDAKPGVRVASGVSNGELAGGVVYAFDRFAVYAVQLPPAAALRWQAGSWSEGLGVTAEEDEDGPVIFQGDPEELTQIVAAHATAAGVLVVRNDGYGGLLDGGDGRVRWSLRLPGLATVRLHVCGDVGGLIWKEGPRVSAALIDLPSGHQQVVELPDPTAWPIWSGLVETGLVLVQRDQIWLVSPGARSRIHRVRAPAGILGAAVTLRTASTRKDETESTLFFGTGDGRLQALGLRSGRTRWTVSDQTEPPAYWTGLDVHGDILAAVALHSATLRSARTGRLLAEFDPGPHARVLHVEPSADNAWVLWADRSRAQPHLQFTRVTLPDKSGTTSAPTERTYHLGPADAVLRAVPAGGRLIVATRAGLHAYVLP